MRVKFDVPRPVRRAKVVNLPSGGQTTIKYDYEKFQKRCYTCQRLTHEQDKCPKFLHKGKVSELLGARNGTDGDGKKENYLKEGDPLFGVLKEDQVGVNLETGRQRVAMEVLDGMRLYLLTQNGDEKVVKEDRVRKTVSNIMKAPNGHNECLTLEPKPTVSLDMDKGIVFGYNR